MDRSSTIVTVGEMLVEFVSHEKDCGLERVGPYSGPYPSGAPAIFLDQASLWGARTAMFGTVGNDGFGRGLLRRLNDDGVGIQGVLVHPTLTTGVAFVSYNTDGSREFIYHLTDTAADRIEFSADLLPAGNLILHVSGASLGAAPMRMAILSAMDAVLDRGGRITCDPNARPQIMKDDASRQALETVIRKSFCLMPSTSDLGFLFPELTEEEAVDRLLQMQAEIVVVKRGSEGTTVVSGGQRNDYAPWRVDEVDPTGAGDGFCGTFVSLLSQGVGVPEAARLANAAGALSVTRRGPMEGNARRADVERFIESFGR